MTLYLSSLETEISEMFVDESVEAEHKGANDWQSMLPQTLTKILSHVIFSYSGYHNFSWEYIYRSS